MRRDSEKGQKELILGPGLGSNTYLYLNTKMWCICIENHKRAHIYI